MGGRREWHQVLNLHLCCSVCVCEQQEAYSAAFFPFSSGYGQDLSGFGQGFSDPSQQPPPYGGPSVQPSSGPPAGGSGFGRGQNHNVQGFHPYRR